MWTPLSTADELAALVQQSHQHPVLLFKHSTTCSISAAAKGKIERQWAASGLADYPIYHLDLLNHRALSAQIAADLGIEHESPQLLLVQNGAVRYHASHLGIRLAEAKAAVQ